MVASMNPIDPRDELDRAELAELERLEALEEINRLDEEAELERMLREDEEDARQAELIEQVAPGDTLEMAHRLVTFISDKKGADVVVLDLEGLTTLADYFVIASANSDRQLNAIADNIRVEGRKHFGRIPLRIEGKGENGWILIDYSDVIVHLFSPTARAYYDLEGLWQEANIVVRIQ